LIYICLTIYSFHGASDAASRDCTSQRELNDPICINILKVDAALQIRIYDKECPN